MSEWYVTEGQTGWEDTLRSAQKSAGRTGRREFIHNHAQIRTRDAEIFPVRGKEGGSKRMRVREYVECNDMCRFVEPNEVMSGEPWPPDFDAVRERLKI